MDQLGPSNLPVHLGLILDGNRRWARSKGLPQLEGHRQGYNTLYDVAVHAIDLGIRYVTAYVFSTENWKRTEEEVGYLMDLVVWVAKHEVEKYVRQGLKVIFLGSRKRLSKKVLDAMAIAEFKTKDCTRGTLAVCLNYGGHMEISDGVARMISDGVAVDDVTPELIYKYLYHPEVPELDLIIRTSGEKRLSNFMLWRAAYAELYFTSVPWPAFTPADLDVALAEFAKRQRRIGQ